MTRMRLSPEDTRLGEERVRMRPTIRQIEVFATVARTLSYTRAAEELLLSQPTVSMQVRQLEQIIGLPLFEQVGRRVFLTDAGRELQNYSQRLLGLLDEMDEVMDALKGLERGTLHIAADTTAGVYLAPPLLGAFQKLHPKTDIRLSVVNRTAIHEQLRQNAVDFAILGQIPDDRELVVAPFRANRLVLIAAPGHPLANERGISLERIAQEPFLLREAGSGTRAAAERLFAERGLSLHLAMELSSNSAIKQAVMAGIGVSVMSDLAIALELAVGKLVTLDVEQFPLMRDWRLAHLKEKRLSPIAAAFKEFLLTDAAEVALTRPGAPTPSHEA